MTDLTIILNFIIIFLLVVAIMYGFVLNKRINLIRQSGRELSHLFRSFDDTIFKAQNGIEDLKQISGTISEELQKKIDRAALLMDDLEFLSNKAVTISKSVENTLERIKKSDSVLPANINRKNIPATPLISEKPVFNAENSKPSLNALKKKALVDLLEEASADVKRIQKKPVEIKPDIAVSKPTQIENKNENKNIDKKQFSIASALKALGYGD